MEPPTSLFNPIQVSSTPSLGLSTIHTGVSMSQHSSEPSLDFIPAAANLSSSDDKSQTTSSNGDPTSAAKSKRQLKREIRFMRQMEFKRARRKEERKKRKLARFATHGTTPSESNVSTLPDNGASSIESHSDLPQVIEKPPAGETRPSKRDSEREIRDRMRRAVRPDSGSYRFAIDCDSTLEHLMSDKEISKLAQQLGHVYGSNRHSLHPAHIFLCAHSTSSKLHMHCCRKNTGFENYTWTSSELPVESLFLPSDVVYLSPDSENVLYRLDPTKVYIIGGLVDGNHLKYTTLTKARRLGFSHARFPIMEVMRRDPGRSNTSFSRVLTVNQVFDILLSVANAQLDSDTPSSTSAHSATNSCTQRNERSAMAAMNSSENIQSNNALEMQSTFTCATQAGGKQQVEAQAQSRTQDALEGANCGVNLERDGSVDERKPLIAQPPPCSADTREAHAHEQHIHVPLQCSLQSALELCSGQNAQNSGSTSSEGEAVACAQRAELDGGTVSDAPLSATASNATLGACSPSSSALTSATDAQLCRWARAFELAIPKRKGFVRKF